MIKIKDSIWEQNIKNQRSDRRFYMAIAIIALFVVVILFLNTFIFFNVQVIGDSMNPTLQTKDVLVANKHKKVERGNIVIISGEKPESKDWLIKRVIAVGGDYIEIKSDGYVYVNDEKLVETYLEVGIKTKPELAKIRLDEKEIFYLGDNRVNSSDSRIYGTCTTEQIVGVVEDWSLDTRGIIKRLYRLNGEVSN